MIDYCPRHNYLLRREASRGVKKTRWSNSDFFCDRYEHPISGRLFFFAFFASREKIAIAAENPKTCFTHQQYHFQFHFEKFFSTKISRLSTPTMEEACWRICELFLYYTLKTLIASLFVVAGFRRHISSCILFDSVMNLLIILLFFYSGVFLVPFLSSLRLRQPKQKQTRNPLDKQKPTSSLNFFTHEEKKRNRQRATDFRVFTSRAILRNWQKHHEIRTEDLLRQVSSKKKKKCAMLIVDGEKKSTHDDRDGLRCEDGKKKKSHLNTIKAQAYKRVKAQSRFG